MRMGRMIGSGLLALLCAAAAQAGPLLHHEPCCPCDCCPPDTFCLKAEVCQHIRTCEVPDQKPATAKAKVVEEKVFCGTRTVPVCITDPHTGCTHNEYKQEAVYETVRHACIDVSPPECGTKPEEHVETCITIHIQRQPACTAPCGLGH